MSKLINFKNFKEDMDEIENLLDGNQLNLFFKKDDDYFGAPENSRIIFAKLKNDDDLTTDFKDQARFIAVNLINTLINGKDSSTTMFGLKDIPKICIIDRQEAVKKLLKKKRSK
ncbi:MAG: hypothetical protein EKK64_10360 [Neisseriaceae bacterium]|nr:MAG: hypothetical protein EKK64_10360 [Neisseriaceae bacterium]